MPSRPTLVFAMAPALTRGLLRDRHLSRLRSLCEIPDTEPLANFEDPRSDDLLARSEILFTGWGCPALTASVLERAPSLRAVIHAAGTVKGHVTGSCWKRDLVVSSAASANAVPGA
jgi:phosphoglycerate dehydrogenase-like enzyme